MQLCPGVHSEHSLMNTRVGPIEHSQMDPTEGSREGGTPTVPWYPFRAFPDGHQGRANRAFSHGPREKQGRRNTASNCALASIQCIP